MSWCKGEKSCCLLLCVGVCLGLLLCQGSMAFAGPVDNVVAAHDDFQGESLVYDLSFWLFRKAARGTIRCSKQDDRYVAELVAETTGLIRIIAGQKKEYMKSVMEYDTTLKRFRPLMFQETFFYGDKERTKTLQFDYSKRSFTISWERTDRKTIRRTKKLPQKTFDDLLTFFYNFRMGHYGRVEEGKTFKIPVLVQSRLSYLSVVVDNTPPTGHRDAHYHGTVSLERSITQAGTHLISGWFSPDLVPVHCVVKDAIFFGDVHIRLRERERAMH